MTKITCFGEVMIHALHDFLNENENEYLTIYLILII